MKNLSVFRFRRDGFIKILRRNHGFTLIEIMVVVFILALLAGIVVPNIIGRSDEARRTSVQVQMKNIEQGLHLFKLDNGFYPSTDQGLEALVNKPTIGRIPKNWRDDGYLPKVPLDAWDNEYVYLSPGTYGDFDLISYGGDGEQGGEGNDADLENWNLE
ncbi:MAG TPA: type II secretion system major pseudopilin GspG [Nitrospiria bacterium]|nr:type II secretion system major pseudopilin GspG [Nitrospiria bacterium]